MDNLANNPFNRFLAYWGTLLGMLLFALLVLIAVGISCKTAARGGQNPDDARRTKLDSESIAAQQAALSSWKKNDDGTYSVPPNAALPKVVNKLGQATVTTVPVPGTKAAEAAAAAAASAAQPPKP